MLTEDLFELDRHSRQENQHPVASAEQLPRCGADRVRQHLGAGENVRHPEGDGRHLAAALLIPLDESRLEARVPLESEAERLSGSLAGHVVGGRPQPAADEHEFGARQQFGDRGRDRVGVVLDAALLHEREAVRGQKTTGQHRVGVYPLGTQELRADRHERRRARY